VSTVTRTDLRRGACPGLSTPMQTGDGLLARLMPTGTMSLDAMAGLAGAARRHGNGIIEITSRGSIQVRGLSDASAPDFADAVARLAIAAHDGPPVIANPLAGLDPDELIDASVLADELRAALAGQPFTTQLAPKISVAIDGGGRLHLDALAADIRLRTVATPDGPRLHVAVGGDAAGALPFGTTTPADAIDLVMRLLRDIAAHGPAARARDVIQTGQRAASPPAVRTRADPIGRHPLHDGGMAIGIAFPFGHVDAAALDALMSRLRAAGAGGVRTSPGRALLIIGVATDHAAHIADAAGRLGFIVAADDPRRRVVACAGAPICASGEFAARASAPGVAELAAPLIEPGEVIHLSGCAKGCAHQGRAALAAVGRDGACDLFIDGAAAGRCAGDQLPQRLAELARPPQPKVRHA
jgi:precorrin-3B synthase